MKKRLLLLAALILLSIGIGIVLAYGSRMRVVAIWNFYPYFFPQHACYTKEGLEKNSGKEYFEERRKIVEERSMGRYLYNLNYGGAHKECRLACQSNVMCSRYVVGWPVKMCRSDISEGLDFTCTLLSSSPIR
ncbi:MAG: hypothetical protein MI824_01700 [Hyphomicrobiales bacterium]|nr:hypothetical protein [Hyphomicrobiales bacterium]